MEAVGFQMTIHLHFFLFFFLVWIVQVSELGLELEERDGGIFVTEVQEHGCVAVHGRFRLFTIYHDLPPMVGMMRCEASFYVLRKACGITKVTGKNVATMI